MHIIHHPDDSGQDIDLAASVAVDEAGIVTVDETRQYRPLCLDDLYPDLDPVERERQVRHLVERYWSKVGRRNSDECWPWLGTIGDLGYGLLSYRHNRNLYAHRLAFIFEHGKIREGTGVLHDCGHKSCVNAAHLKSGGDAENMLDAIRHGTHAYRTKLAASEWDAIRERYFAGGATYRELAKEFGVSLATIGNVVTGQTTRPKTEPGIPPNALLTSSGVLDVRQRVRAGEKLVNLAAELGVDLAVLRNAVYGYTWRELPGALPPPGQVRGEKVGTSKLTEEQVLDIRQRVAAGETQGEMARNYGVSRSMVSLIVNRKRWTYLDEGGQC